jgi:hypothetical protein
LHIASNMHMKIQCYVKILLFEILAHTITQYYFQKISLLHSENNTSSIEKKALLLYTG